MSPEKTTEIQNLLSNKFLFLDTTFFFDAYPNPTLFVNLLRILKASQTEVVTIPLVRLEFLKGSDLIRDFELKNKFINEIVDAVIPVDPQVIKDLEQVSIVYRKDSSHLSVTDAMLAAFLKRYNPSFLLTRNHKDFPTSLFDRKILIPIEYEKEVQVHGVYQLNVGKYNEAMVRLIDIHNRSLSSN